MDLFTNIGDCEILGKEAEAILLSLSQAMVQQSKNLPHTKPCQKRLGKAEWTTEVAEAYSEANHAWKRWKDNGKPIGVSLHDVYLQLKKVFRQRLRQARAVEHRRLLSSIESASTGNSRLFYQLIKRQRTNITKRQTEVLEYQGCTYEKGDVAAGWKCYFTDLAQPTLNAEISQITIHDKFEPNEVVPMVQESALITSHELDVAIASLKKGKASGPDDISPEHIKYLGATARRLILLVFNSFLVSSFTPQSLKNGLVLPLHKGKGKDVKDPRNYRGITLTSTLCKLIELALKPRIQRSLEENNIPDELQFGFQKHHSCILTSCCLELIIELNSANKTPTLLHS
nr:uncharacterized protein LOC129261626 [Lytechinus pictus]